MANEKLKKLGARCELARRSFFWYCNLKAPDFYKKIGFTFKMMVEKNNNEGYGELYYKEF